MYCDVVTSHHPLYIPKVCCSVHSMCVLMSHFCSNSAAKKRGKKGLKRSLNWIKVENFRYGHM